MFVCARNHRSVKLTETKSRQTRGGLYMRPAIGIKLEAYLKVRAESCSVIVCGSRPACVFSAEC